MAVVKKYMAVSNWDQYPEVKGLKISDGNLHRTLCSCGFAAAEHMSECPICGNKSFRSVNASHYEYDVHDLKSLMLKKNQIRYTYTKTNGVSTAIDKKVGTEVFYLQNCSHNLFEIIEALPILESVPQIKMAMEIRQYFVDNKWMPESTTGWSSNSNFHTIFRFVCSVYEQTPEVTVDDLKNAFVYFYGGDMLTKLQTFKQYKNIYATMCRLANVPASSQVIAKDLIVFRLLIDNPRYYAGIDPVIGELIAAYYAEDYISNINYLLEIVREYKFNEKSRTMFIKYFKDIYANPGYAWSKISTMLQYIDEGNYFENTKDYYMQKNYQKLVAAYGVKKVDPLLNDVYKHPADVLIELANS